MGSAKEHTVAAVGTREEIPALFPDEQPIPDDVVDGQDLTELAVWVCEQCFDGLIRLPLRDSTGRWVDQGIDLFFHQRPLKEIHRCSFSQLEPPGSPPTKDSDLKLAFARAVRPRGKWQAKKLALPIAVKDRIMEQTGATPGRTTDESRLRQTSRS